MYDLKMLKRAKLYADAMAQGINPLNGEFVSKDDSLSQGKLQICMGYISQVLNDVIKNHGTAPKTSSKGKRASFSITTSQKDAVQLSNEPIGINEVARRINAVIDTDVMKSVPGTKIASWLAVKGYLDVIETANNKTQKVVNSKSVEIGITVRDKVNIETGEIYKQPVYNKIAQQYILEHIEEIVR